jgi:hypothetical protein
LLVCADADSGKILWQKQVDHLVLWPAEEAKKAREQWNEELKILYEFRTTGMELAFVNGAWQENAQPEKSVPALKLADAEARKARLDKLTTERNWTFGTSGIKQGYDLIWSMYPSEKHSGPTGEEGKKHLAIRVALYATYGFNFEQWRGYLGNTYRTPTSDGKHVFVSMAYGQVACYDLDGKLVWMQFLHPAGSKGIEAGQVGRRMLQGTGHCPSPLLIGDTLISRARARESGRPGRTDARTGSWPSTRRAARSVGRSTRSRRAATAMSALRWRCGWAASM